MEKEQMMKMIETAKQRAKQEIKGFSSLTEDQKTAAICSFFPETDGGNAARLVLRFGELMAFVETPAGKQWMAFDGRRWVGGEAAEEIVNRFCEESAARILDEIPFLKHHRKMQ